MKNRFSQKEVLLAIGYILFVLLITIILLCFNKANFNESIQIFFIITLSHMVITYICFIILGINFFSVSGIFISLSYVFHFGQVIVKGLSHHYKFSFDVYNQVPNEVYISSMIFSTVSISFIALGMIFIKVFKIKSSIKNSHIREDDNKLAIHIGWTILLLSFPVKVYISINQFFIANKLGYLAALNSESSGILSQISNFHIIGISLLIMAYVKRRFYSILIYSLYSLFSILTMLSGIRIYPILSLMVVTYIFVRSLKIKISFKYITVFSFPLFFLIVLLNTIAEVRLEGWIGISAFLQVFMDTLKNNPLFNILEEFGATIYTVSLTFMKVPMNIDYSYGKQFLLGFITVLPNLKGVFSSINETLVYTKFFEVQAIGGSYIGELYYSLGYFSLVLALFIGAIIQIVSERLEIYLENNQYIKVSYYILLVFSLFLWVRGYYVGILRNTIWSMVLISVLQILLRPLLRKKANRITD